MDRIVYLDNAATGWPKPQCVTEAMVRFSEQIGANPGRSGHRLSVEAARVVYGCREGLAELFNLSDPLRMVFTLNVTEALNLAFHGLLRPGDHVVTSSVEHNSVMRPLRALQDKGLEITVVNCDSRGRLDPAHLEAAIRPHTALIVINHASNVLGTVLNVREAGRIARRCGVLLLVDAAQTAGVYPIDMISDRIDLLAFTGHKYLGGPTGTGGLALGERVDVSSMRPLKRGGTGSRSEEERQPRFLPDMLESGTLNTIGLAGLEAGIRWLQRQGVSELRRRLAELAGELLEGLREIRSVSVYGPVDREDRTGTVSFTISGIEPSRIAYRLDKEFSVMGRAGLHCAPAAHRTIGTFPEGTVRFALGPFNTKKDVEVALDSVEKIASEGG